MLTTDLESVEFVVTMSKLWLLLYVLGSVVLVNYN